MGRSKGDHRNLAKVKQFLEENDIEYFQLNEWHFRIIGETSLVDLWPTRMTYHIIESEKPVSVRYHRLNIDFDAKELKKIL